jgi:phenylacetate-coenzyme A ligase PaaK-like adenylate-forming protein
MPAYGNSETHGLRAHACEELARLGKDRVHLDESAVDPELINSTGEVIEEGELVLSVLWERNMFPVTFLRH